MTVSTEARGEVITFYSYKGGTGRSMALSNVACLLAEQKRVLMVDWDLEAPGLHRFFYRMLPGTQGAPEQYLEEKPGLIDLLYEIEARLPPVRKGKVGQENEKATAVLVEQIELDRFITPLTRPNLSLLKAGSLNGSYSQRVNTFRWEAFFERAPSLFRLFAERLCREFDYVLVDSRTGLTDISGICTMLLPEKLVVVFTPNSQSLTGIRELVQRALRYRRSSEDMRPLLVFPLPSRIEASLDKLRNSWRFGDQEQGIEGFQPMFEALLQEIYGLEECDLGKYFDEAQIQQTPDYAYGEEIAVLAPQQEDRFSLNRSYRTFTEYVTGSEGPWALRGWDEAPLITQLSQEAEVFDRSGVERTCNEIGAHLAAGEALSEPGTKKVLSTLRRRGFPDLMEKIARALIDSGRDTPKVRRLYAQSLIDQGKLLEAVQLLERLLTQTSDDPAEHKESLGLLGRAHKHLYLNAVKGDPQASQRKLNQIHLQRAIDSYSAAYRADSELHLWQGINAAALLCRAQRDAVSFRGSFSSPETLAQAILSSIEKRKAQGQLASWDLATAVEACIALKRDQEALDWMRLYLQSDADVFELSSVLHQLTEVWQLSVDTLPGATLLPLLQAAILKLGGGRVDLDHGQSTSAIEGALTLEKSFGTEPPLSLSWYREGLDLSRAVAQIRTETGEGFGTGFLVRGGDFDPKLGDELLLLTNAHVISDDPTLLSFSPLSSDEAVIVFEALDSSAELRVREILWTSPPNELDTSLLRLERQVSGVMPCPIASGLPALDKAPRVYIIGYPGGGRLSFSLSDNLLLDYDDRVLHYRTPTVAGSAGSPVFNHRWKVIGLHHAGGVEMPRLNGKPGTYTANEGIQIQRIIQAVKAAGTT